MILLSLVIFFALLYLLRYLKNKKILSFSFTVLLAIIFGLVYGAVLQMLFKQNPENLHKIIDITGMVGHGYVRLLTMLVMPLVSISLFSAIFNLKLGKGIVKKTMLYIIFLIAGSLIGAAAGISMTLAFDLNAQGMLPQEAETQRGQLLEEKLQNLESKSIPTRMIEMIPENPFADLSGSRSNSMIGVVIFTILFGIAALQLKMAKPERYDTLRVLVNNLRNIVNKLARMIILLTPYGVFALMLEIAATQDMLALLNLITFVIASYLALIIVLIVFLIVLAVFGLNPITFIKKCIPVTILAFVTRSSAGAIPLSYATQKQLGVNDGFASLASTLGTSIGQAGCAGVFPAMVAMMIAPTVGINPLDTWFILSVLGVVTIASFGVSSVGGGATFAAIIVLSTLNLPVALVGLLISIEPIIDMGRTALNVVGSISSSVIVNKISGDLDMNQYKMPLDSEKLGQDQEHED